MKNQEMIKAQSRADDDPEESQIEGVSEKSQKSEFMDLCITISFIFTLRLALFLFLLWTIPQEHSVCEGMFISQPVCKLGDFF